MNDEMKRELFDRDVDIYCDFARKTRPRCAEWVAFSEHFLPYFETWNGCWVAEEAVCEWYYYVSLPPGQYQFLEYPEGHDFYRPSVINRPNS